jgi:hypothetical protein
VQTPYFWFPVEPHFIKLCHHWLPRPLRVRLWQRWNMGNRKRATTLDEAISKMEDEPYLLDQPMSAVVSCKPDSQGALFPVRQVPHCFPWPEQHPDVASEVSRGTIPSPHSQRHLQR